MKDYADLVREMSRRRRVLAVTHRLHESVCGAEQPASALAIGGAEALQEIARQDAEGSLLVYDREDFLRTRRSRSRRR